MLISDLNISLKYIFIFSHLTKISLNEELTPVETVKKSSEKQSKPKSSHRVAPHFFTTHFSCLYFFFAFFSFLYFFSLVFLALISCSLISSPPCISRPYFFFSLLCLALIDTLAHSQCETQAVWLWHSTLYLVVFTDTWSQIHAFLISFPMSGFTRTSSVYPLITNSPLFVLPGTFFLLQKFNFLSFFSQTFTFFLCWQLSPDF